MRRRYRQLPDLSKLRRELVKKEKKKLAAAEAAVKEPPLQRRKPKVICSQCGREAIGWIERGRNREVWCRDCWREIANKDQSTAITLNPLYTRRHSHD